MTTCKTSLSFINSTPRNPFLSKNLSSVYALFSSAFEPRFILLTGIYALYVNNGFLDLACMELSAVSFIVFWLEDLRVFSYFWYVVNLLLSILLILLSICLSLLLLDNSFSSSSDDGMLSSVSYFLSMGFL